MEKTEARRLIDRLGGHRRDALIRTGYVTQDGQYLTVEGIIIGLCGRDQDVTGVRVRVVSVHGGYLPRRDEDNTAALSLARIVEGEKIRAERAAEQEREAAERGAPAAGVAAIFGRPKRATARQVAYAADLAVQAALIAADDMDRIDSDALMARARAEFAAMSRDEISLRISELRGEL